jgi:hypothetical protein
MLTANSSLYSKSRFLLAITNAQSMRSIVCNHAKRVWNLQPVAVWNCHFVAYGIKLKQKTIQSNDWCHTVAVRLIPCTLRWFHTKPSVWINKTSRTPKGDVIRGEFENHH